MRRAHAEMHRTRHDTADQGRVNVGKPPEMRGRVWVAPRIDRARLRIDSTRHAAPSSGARVQVLVRPFWRTRVGAGWLHAIVRGVRSLSLGAERLNIRAGRQQIAWCETSSFRLLTASMVGGLVLLPAVLVAVKPSFVFGKNPRITPDASVGTRPGFDPTNVGTHERTQPSQSNRA